MVTLKSVILLLASAQGFLLSIALILSSLKRRPANIYLSLILIVCSLELQNALLIPTGYHSRENAFPFWLLGSYLIFPASLLLFVNLHTHPGFQVTPKHLLLFTPAVAEISVEFFSFYYTRITGISLQLAKNTGWFLLTEILPVISTIAVLAYYWSRLRKTQHTANATLKKTKPDLRHYGFLIAFGLLLLLWCAETIFHFNSFPVTELLICIFLFFLGLIVYFRPTFFDVQIGSRAKFSEEMFRGFDDEEQKLRLLRLFESNRIYRTPRLSIEDVGKELALPPRYVSYLIGKYCESNFNNFVNSYRVKEALSRIKDPAENNRTLLGIALDSGFSSKSAFNQVFKDFMGKAPSAYLSKEGNSSKNMIPDVRD